MATTLLKSCNEKLDLLYNYIDKFDKVAIAYSGGIDSTFLGAAAKNVLGKNVYLVTTCSYSLSKQELKEAANIAEELNLPHILLDSTEFECPNFIKNDHLRCYYCKKNKLLTIKEWTDKEHIPIIFEGTHKDDETDHRPGKAAIAEIKEVTSPLNKTGFTKAEIRCIAKKWQLSNWNKPSKSCLATKIAEGLPITPEKVQQIEECKIYLGSNNLKTFKLKHHDDILKIEITNYEAAKFFPVKYETEKKIKALGFKEIYYNINLTRNKNGF